MKLVILIERFVVAVLLGMMMLTVVVATVELGVILAQQLAAPPKFLLNIEEMLEVFGFFLMVLLGLELLETLKAYLSNHSFHVEVVMLVAIVAVSRKVILLDKEEWTGAMMLGVSALLLSLSGGYYLVKRGMLLGRHSAAAGHEPKPTETSAD